MGALFLPGKLTEAYFEGRHQRYVRPIRLFFITAIIHFAIMNSVLSSLPEEAFDFVLQNQKNANQAEFLEEIKLERDSVLLQHAGNPAVARALDSLMVSIDHTGNDSISMSYLEYTDAGTLETKDISFSLKDIFSGEKAGKIIEAAGVTNGWSKLQLAQLIKFNKSGGNFPAFIIGKLIWMVLLMMPALALVLKLLYIRRKRYFIEHLVFSYHYHAFAFIIMAIAMLTGGSAWFNQSGEEVESSIDAFMSWAILIIMIYLFWAMRRVYKQGIFKTFVKYLLLNFSYLLLFITALTLTFVVSFLLF